MTLDMIQSFLLWSLVINMILFFLTFLIFAFCRNFVYKMHSRWYKVSARFWLTTAVIFRWGMMCGETAVVTLTGANKLTIRSLIAALPAIAVIG